MAQIRQARELDVSGQNSETWYIIFPLIFCALNRMKKQEDEKYLHTPLTVKLDRLKFNNVPNLGRFLLGAAI